MPTTPRIVGSLRSMTDSSTRLNTGPVDSKTAATDAGARSTPAIIKNRAT